MEAAEASAPREAREAETRMREGGRCSRDQNSSTQFFCDSNFVSAGKILKNSCGRAPNYPRSTTNGQFCAKPFRKRRGIKTLLRNRGQRLKAKQMVNTSDDTFGGALSARCYTRKEKQRSERNRPIARPTRSTDQLGGARTRDTSKTKTKLNAKKNCGGKIEKRPG